MTTNKPSFIYLWINEQWSTSLRFDWLENDLSWFISSGHMILTGSFKRKSRIWMCIKKHYESLYFFIKHKCQVRGSSSKSPPEVEWGLVLLLYISGKLPDWHEVKWRKDSCLNDGIQFGSDLSGGFFDAGDYMKFTFPLAFTMNVLSWSLEGTHIKLYITHHWSTVSLESRHLVHMIPS